jgi:hypothetical protein
LGWKGLGLVEFGFSPASASGGHEDGKSQKPGDLGSVPHGDVLLRGE